MPRRYLVFSIIATIFLILILAIQPLTCRIITHQLQKIFSDSTVSIKQCQINPLKAIQFSHVKIQNRDQSTLIIPNITIMFDWFYVLQGQVTRIIIQDPEILLINPQKTISNLNLYLIDESSQPSSKKNFTIHQLKINNFKFSIKTKDLTLSGKVSTELDVMQQIFKSLNLDLTTLEYKNIKIKNGLLNTSQENSGRLFIESIAIDKLKINNVAAQTRIQDQKIICDSLSAYLLNGKVNGEFNIETHINPDYRLSLEVVDLDTQRFVTDFELNKKFTMTGLIGGKFILAGRGTKFHVINGDFTLGVAGGVLIVHDTHFLENFAKNSQQSLELVIDSFKNYNYNIGTIHLKLEQENIVAQANLEGKAGKRNLMIVLHNFTL